MRAAIYARVSTNDQTCENQLRELRAYCQARGLVATEFVDAGVSGAKESRPALDAMLREAKLLVALGECAEWAVCGGASLAPGCPRDPMRQRSIRVDDAVRLVNEFLRARFLDAADVYPPAQAVAVRDGDRLEFAFEGSADSGVWELALRLGVTTKVIRLHGDYAPCELRDLRERLKQIAGPLAW